MHDAADDGRVRIVRCDEAGLPPQYKQMSEQVLKAQGNKPGRNGRGHSGKSGEVDLPPGTSK